MKTYFVSWYNTENHTIGNSSIVVNENEKGNELINDIIKQVEEMNGIETVVLNIVEV